MTRTTRFCTTLFSAVRRGRPRRRPRAPISGTRRRTRESRTWPRILRRALIWGTRPLQSRGGYSRASPTWTGWERPCHSGWQRACLAFLWTCSPPRRPLGGRSSSSSSKDGNNNNRTRRTRIRLPNERETFVKPCRATALLMWRTVPRAPPAEPHRRHSTVSVTWSALSGTRVRETRPSLSNSSRPPSSATRTASTVASW
mmetsp:Transcript_10044/g.34662  ORF Transcript_10044/g.34662 Transcript_10044/m.34662 type:complete len:200 (+) Transcript_10044:850-1449(+)